ncbi:hypothetical protein EVAR_6392_1 [Eumeta japonica]|uniref:Uncharacterized protein n=1 Tax=Eumeta variegata TaxID=151549 RepID=A0A4C1TDC7_EUMVA|nr:hypothetical protein EVAR_6392_1 [Eumeta japonica]
MTSPLLRALLFMVRPRNLLIRLVHNECSRRSGRRPGAVFCHRITQQPSEALGSSSARLLVCVNIGRALSGVVGNRRALSGIVGRRREVSGVIRLAEMSPDGTNSIRVFLASG